MHDTESSIFFKVLHIPYVLIHRSNGVAKVDANVPTQHLNIYRFHAVFGKFDKIVCWRPLEELASPIRGNPGSATVYK